MVEGFNCNGDDKHLPVSDGAARGDAGRHLGRQRFYRQDQRVL